MVMTALSAGTLKGDAVKNGEGEDLGQLEEIMIDLDSGRVAYVVLAAGGIFGMGEKYFAVPWGMMSVDLDDHALVLDVDKETIENSPGFDKDNWPDPNDMNWLNEVYVHYDVEPFFSPETR